MERQDFPKKRVISISEPQKFFLFFHVIDPAASDVSVPGICSPKMFVFTHNLSLNYFFLRNVRFSWQTVKCCSCSSTAKTVDVMVGVWCHLLMYVSLFGRRRSGRGFRVQNSGGVWYRGQGQCEKEQWQKQRDSFNTVWSRLAAAVLGLWWDFREAAHHDASGIYQSTAGSLCSSRCRWVQLFLHLIMHIYSFIL